VKVTVETAGMSASRFGEYVSVGAVLLARAHSQSDNASILRDYVGANDTVHGRDRPVLVRLPDKSLDDFHQLRAAAAAGDIEVADDPAR
jgi:Uncharacterized protein conserved in bacteria (DUF2252)